MWEICKKNNFENDHMCEAIFLIPSFTSPKSLARVLQLLLELLYLSSSFLFFFGLFEKVTDSQYIYIHTQNFVLQTKMVVASLNQ